MDLTWLGQFCIITFAKIDFSLIICHLVYLTFWINFWLNLRNQYFQLIYIKLMAPLAYDILLYQIYIHKRIYFYLLNYV